MRDTATVSAAIRRLATQYVQTDVVEYEGCLHVRVGRHVVAVYDADDDSIIIRKPANRAEAKRLQEVMDIVNLDREIATIDVLNEERTVQECVFVWQDPRPTLGSPAQSSMTERERFSCITNCSLTTEAARTAHEEALNA